jgi:hypothetical protein
MWRSVFVLVLVAVLAAGTGAATLVTKEPGMAPQHTEIQAQPVAEVLRSVARPQGVRAAGGESAAASSDGVPRSPAVPPDVGDLYWLMENIQYGAQTTSPLCYGNTRHVVRQMVADIPWCTWETGDPHDNEVYYTYWDDLFWTFTTPESLSSSGDDAGRISVVSDLQGTIHAVWHQSDDYDLDPHESYYAQRPFGGDWSDAVQLSADDLKNSVFPVIDIDASGNPWVVWMDRTETPSILHGLYATYSTDGGLTWDPSTVHRISDVDTTIDIPAMAADPNNGDIWVAYEEDEWDPADIWQDIAVYHYTPGVGWDGGTIVAYSDTAFGEPNSKPNMEATLVVDANSVCHVAYQDNQYDGNQAGYGTYDANVYQWIGNICRVHNAAGTWSEPEMLWPADQDRLGDRTGSWQGIGVIGVDDEGNLYCSTDSYVFVDTTYLYGIQKEAVVGRLAVGESEWKWRIASRINEREDSTHCKYAQIAQEIPADGPDVIWDEALEGGVLPFDVLYTHLDTDFTAPGSVMNLAAAVVEVDGGVGVKLVWQNPDDADWDGSEIYRDVTEDPQIVGLGVLMPLESEPVGYGMISEYVDTAVVAGTMYYYGVTAWDEVGNYSPTMNVAVTVGDPDTEAPGSVTDFEATYVGAPGVLGTVELAWTNPGDADWYGTVLRRSSEDYPATAMDGDLVYDGMAASFADSMIDQNMVYYYSAFAYDVAGNYADAAQDTAVVPLGAEDGGFTPSAGAVRLEAPSPNPSSSTMEFRLHVATGAFVDLSAYDASGRLVATILRDRVTAGAHRVSWNVGRLPAGVYVVRASAAGSSASCKVAVVQ